MKKAKLGVIFPISSKSINSLFGQKRNIFVKFTNFKKLEKGSKIVFYVSREKKLVGEGTIEKVERLNPEVAWIRYAHQIFLNEREYDHYITKSPISGEDRKMTKITLFILKNLRRYNELKECSYNITPTGRYLRQIEYQKIWKKNKND